MTLETYKVFTKHQIEMMINEIPQCWNQEVFVKRYRITIEEIPESNEVLGARLEKLWEETENMHDYGPLQEYAKSIGYVYQKKFGEKNIHG